MVQRIEKHGLQVDQVLVDFIEHSALEGTGVSSDAFWAGLSQLAHDLGPKNRALLAVREDIQSKLDAWHRDNKKGGYSQD
ncbi:MAG: malate synthase G, partial [Planktotalea sp.]